MCIYYITYSYMLSNKIYLNVFIVSVAIGIFLLYILEDDRKIVYVYPNIDTYKDIFFKDETTDTCYNYKPSRIKCPTDVKKIVPISTYNTYAI